MARRMSVGLVSRCLMAFSRASTPSRSGLNGGRDIPSNTTSFKALPSVIPPVEDICPLSMHSTVKGFYQLLCLFHLYYRSKYTSTYQQEQR